MSNTIWAVDGSFFAQRVSGIQRYSIELLAALDRIVSPGFVEIVTPQGVTTPAYQNIRAVPFGTRRGLAWQQLDYPEYLKRRGAKGLATCNIIPWFGFRGIGSRSRCLLPCPARFLYVRPRPPERRLALPAIPPHCPKGRAHHHGVGVFQI